MPPYVVRTRPSSAIGWWPRRPCTNRPRPPTRYPLIGCVRRRAGMTPAIDGAFAALARDRIAAHPLRYHVVLPAKRALTPCRFDTHADFYPFADTCFRCPRAFPTAQQQMWLPPLRGSWPRGASRAGPARISSRGALDMGAFPSPVAARIVPRLGAARLARKPGAAIHGGVLSDCFPRAGQPSVSKDSGASRRAHIERAASKHSVTHMATDLDFPHLVQRDARGRAALDGDRAPGSAATTSGRGTCTVTAVGLDEALRGPISIEGAGPVPDRRGLHRPSSSNWRPRHRPIRACSATSCSSGAGR